MMKKKIGLWIVLACTAVFLSSLAGCNNFLHELIPPDENRITSFSLPGQLGQAQIGETTITVTVGPGTDIAALVPSIGVSPKATLLPVTIPYIQKAFPQANVFQDGMGLYLGQDRANQVIDLIERDRNFTAPALDEAIDFSEPVLFLVISGLGSVRQYTVTVDVDTGEGKVLSFAFTKFDNPDLTRGDAAGTIHTAAKTIDVTVWYPVENIASFKLIPRFETNGAAISLEGTELVSGTSEIDFTKPASGGWGTVLKNKTLIVRRPGFTPVEYTLTVRFTEDPDTSRAITDFRFTQGLNYGISPTVMGTITDTGDTGTIALRVHHTGAVPATLRPSFVSPGTVSVEGAAQTSGANSHDFSQPVYYQVVSRNGLQRRTYRVTVSFVSAADPRPRMEHFVFTTAGNPALAANTSALIDHDAGLIVMEAVYTADPPPYTLVPEFTAGGIVEVNGTVQISGAGSQDFSRRVKYRVSDPGNPGLYREYWVEARFVKQSRSLAEIREFRFDTADNPGLCGSVTAVIDQAAGTITAVLPFNGLPPGTGGGHRVLVPRWLAQGTVTVDGAIQTSGAGGRIFGPSVVYRVRSADGAFRKDYTVKVQEVNTRIYVDADATGDHSGLSWANAFKSLQDACAVSEHLPAAVQAEVWIAEGSYRPSESRDTTANFKVRGNTGYYGGFAGTETAKTGRDPDPAAHPVVITGDLGGGVYTENLFMNTDLEGRNAVFDGMTFTKARDFTGVQQRGPAIFVNKANSVHIAGCVFTDTRARVLGGAVSIANGTSVTITGCTFTDTSAGSFGGAVSASTITASITLTDCSFENLQGGGAVYTSDGSSGTVSIRDCRFENIQGSHAVDSNGSQVVIRDCTFTDIHTSLSGGAVNTYAGSTIIRDCRFTTIVTTNTGSGGAVNTYGSTTITDCEFENTSIPGGNGGAINTVGDLSITGCTFKNTESVWRGGAIYMHGGTLNILNSSFTNSRTGNQGGAICAFGPVSCTLSGVSFKNCSSNAPSGDILFGAKFDTDPSAPVYTVRPGCSVDGTAVTAANFSWFKSLPRVYLISGAVINFVP